MVCRPATILGGLPVIAEVSFSYDGYTMEHDACVEALYWRKRDGSAGKQIPQAVFDRALKYDYGLCNVIESVSEQLAYEHYEDKKMEQLS